MDKPFILSTDASEHSMGYILSQIQNEREHVIAYGGRTLRGSELKWHITDKEALALVEGIQHFRHYLANQEFLVITDNVSVKYLQKIKDCNGRLGRWSLLLQAYNFKIQHRSGNKNPADFLSRQDHPNTEPEHSSELSEHLYSISDNQKEYTEATLFYGGENVDSIISSLNSIQHIQGINNIVLPNLATEQQRCPALSDIIQYKQFGQVPVDPAKARTIVAESYNYEVEDGILKHFYSKRCKKVPQDERLVKQIAVPKVLRDDLLKSYHDCIAGGGHQGFERTYAALRNKYFWQSMYSDINTYVKTCETCQQSKRAFNARPPPLQPQQTHDVFQRWHIDILSGLPTTKDKFKHILLVVDSYSKWCEAFPLRTQEAKEVANVLYKEIITRYGAPRILISDRGKTFVSNIVKALSELFNITRHLTSSYHPQTNGSVERMNSVILQAFRAYTKDMQDDWIDYLPGIMMAYRATPATQSTDYSPFFLLYGREMSLPIDTSLVPKDHLTQDNKIFLARILQNLETTSSKNINKIMTKEQKIQNLDQHNVFGYTAQKFQLEKLQNYTVSGNCATNKEVKSLVNAQRLKPYHDPEARPTNIPNDMENNMDEHDPDELDDQPDLPIPQPNNNNQQIQEDRTDRNNEQVDQPENQDNNNVPDTQPTLVRGNNAPVKDTRPSCKDCDRGNCKPFSENEIDSIISSARGNGTLYYKIKFTEKTRKTDWYFTCKIPCRLVREFHAKRTMGGKKRKRPLQKHKFFNKPDENVNHIAQTKLTKDSATQTELETDINSINNCDKEKLISVRLFHQEAYFLVQHHNKQAWQPMTMAKDHAATFIETRKEAFKIHRHELRMQYMKHKFKYGDKKPFITGPTTEAIFEAFINKDGKDEFLISYKNMNIPPEWALMAETPNGLMDTFLNKLEDQYNTEISIDW
ncbi:unnamed protein product [Mytilus edulis]|uniref:Integrase catalytic domain-containing protein n=1 Tax=Mytilus edulis TaxID=6550 RepID=A0A8S3T4C2_MYTED|nr:unnamed protein product [Mytilus edulis]